MFDVFFVRYNEPNAEQNYRRLNHFAPHTKTINGVSGIHAAHQACAQQASTNHFFTVDADNWVLNDFSFEVGFEVRPDTVYVWRCRNPVNDLVYGYGAIKLFPTEYVASMNTQTVDMTTSSSPYYEIVNVLASETRFNSSEYDAWRSGFREAVKLASASIPRQVADETRQRLDIWCSHGLGRPYGCWTLDGAREGREYGTNHANNPEALAKINDFQWVSHRFRVFCKTHGVAVPL
jgi:hypothetical protein